MKIKAVGFDFDGTLIMSEELKALQFVRIFKERFNVEKGVLSCYKRISRKGINREEKIRLLFEHFLKRKPTSSELKELDDEFGRYYEQSLKTCPLFQCTNIIRDLKKQVDFLFLLSLENKREVERLVRHCGLSIYFDEILGGPTAKVDNLKYVLAKHHLKASEVLYIGDSTSDIIASRKVKVKVVLIQKKFSYHQLLETLETDFVFSSLCEVPTMIEKFERRR